MTMTRLLPLCLSFLLLAASLVPVNADDSRYPAEVVEGFHAALVEVMKNADDLGVNGRFDKLAPAMDEAFDFATMIRVASTRRFWNDAGDAGQKRLLEVFRRLSIATYAAQFDGYSGQRFETVGERDGPQGTILVATKIVDPDGSDVGLTYVVKKTDSGDWKIADVLLDDSISQLAVRRSEYSKILKDSGIEGLIGELQGKADKLLGAG